MRKYKKLALVAITFATASNLAFADGSAFTPLNFDDVSDSTSYSAPQTLPVENKSTNPVSNVLSKIMPDKNTPAINSGTGEIPVGNDNIQNAILELDNAQVGIRNDLLNYKAKYADVDAQYKLVKQERKMLYRQVKSIERRIRSLDKAKEKIRKNML